MNEREKLIHKMRAERTELNKKISELDVQLTKLELENNKEHFNCPCVQLNKDIGIYSSGDQVRAGRCACAFGGLVADTLSAEKNCPMCKGWGRERK